jgi:Kae1-associated kinase Bud32
LHQQQKILTRGAEAILYKDEFEGQLCLVKERIRKGYRIPELDSALRSERTRHEARLLSEARRAGVATPAILSVDERECKIIMEFIDGPRLKELINSGISDERRAQLAERIGQATGKLHSHGIIHGDLTTSNMVLRGEKIYFIDFGLGELSTRAEAAGTDLAVLSEALRSTHFRYLSLLWQNFKKGYYKTNKQAEAVLAVLADIEKRGRYVRRVCD